MSWITVNGKTIHTSQLCNCKNNHNMKDGINGKRITKKEALEGLGDPATWESDAKKLNEEFTKKPDGVRKIKKRPEDRIIGGKNFQNSMEGNQITEEEFYAMLPPKSEWANIKKRVEARFKEKPVDNKAKSDKVVKSKAKEGSTKKVKKI
jgi:hypothetical protein